MTTPLWSKLAPTRVRAAAIALLLIVAVLRFGLSVVSAAHFNQGDFFATMPGVYAEKWNLTLWDSRDLDTSEQVFRHGYSYGPAQYLTLWPMVFLDSYHQIAAVLLIAYVGVIVLTAYVLWRLCEQLIPLPAGYRWGRGLTVLSAVLLYGPLQNALGQREFEVVQTLMLVSAAYLVVRGRPGGAGAVLGYISLFKYWPVALLAYFTLKRQWKAVAAFLVTVALVLLAAHAMFDLRRFPFASSLGIRHQFGRIYDPAASAQPFCSASNGTTASLHMGLCAILGGRHRVAQGVFSGLVVGAAALFVVIFVMLERRGAQGTEVRRWRQVLEFCFFLIAGGVVVHGHYYYLTILILPLTLMLYDAFWGSSPVSWRRLAPALLAYAALSPFIVPIAVVARVTGGDPWSAYLSHGIYAYGDGMIVGLLFWKYATLLEASGK